MIVSQKAKALSALFDCADKYNSLFNNHSLLFICMDKHKHISTLEVTFDASNFLHLTGCTTNRGISALDFFNRCVEKRLSLNDFELADDGTTLKKLKILPLMLTKNLSANSIGDFIGGRPKLQTDKLAGGMRGCMGFVKTAPSGRFVPNTVLEEDIRNVIHNNLRIIATYRKNIKDKDYDEIVYVAKNID